MSLKCGIVGLPNVGKSTLFNALTNSSIPAENYPFCTIEPHLGIVQLPDPRLEQLKTVYNPLKVTPSFLEFVDIAGLVKGASNGEGLGNQFLGQIRQTAAILHVVRCFDDENINHVNSNVNPVRDIEIIETELLLADIQTLEKQQLKIKKTNKINDLDEKLASSMLEELINHCSNGMKANTFKIDKELIPFKKSLFLLTDKPILYVANIDELCIINKTKNIHLSSLENYLSSNYPLVTLCFSLEEEIAQLENEEKSLFLSEYNLRDTGLNKVIQSSFNLLGLQTFFTCGEKEVRSWTIKKGILAPKAAGEIHTDFERGFIKAEVFHYNELIKYGKEKALREAGLIRQEGKNYIVKDGDCIFFRFNV